MSAHPFTEAGVMRQNPDGSWSPAEPIRWVEEHNWLQRLILRLRGIEHCTAEAEVQVAPLRDEVED